MSQYDIAKLVFESQNGLSVTELRRRTGTAEGTVRTGLLALIRKDLVVQSNSKLYKKHPNADNDDLERLRPPTIDELNEEP